MIRKSQTHITFGLFLAAALMLSVGTASSAQEHDASPNEVKTEVMALTHGFIKKHYSIKGTAKIIKTQAGTEIVFSEGFATRSGPDLKVYLSRLPIETLEDSTVKDNSLKIGVLKSKSGAQSYFLPDGISLADYKSVVIHCEAFSKLWGGFDL